jgi:hypothetical protein
VAGSAKSRLSVYCGKRGGGELRRALLDGRAKMGRDIDILSLRAPFQTKQYPQYAQAVNGVGSTGPSVTNHDGQLGSDFEDNNCTGATPGHVTAAELSQIPPALVNGRGRNLGFLSR